MHNKIIFKLNKDIPYAICHLAHGTIFSYVKYHLANGMRLLDMPNILANGLRVFAVPCDRQNSSRGMAECLGFMMCDILGKSCY